MATESNDCERWAAVVRGLGLGNEWTVKRVGKVVKGKKRSKRMGTLTKEMNCSILRQTPSNHLFVIDRNGEPESLFTMPEVCFTVVPLDTTSPVFALPEGMWCGTGEPDMNERVYKAVKDGLVPLRPDHTTAGGPVLPCSHLIYLDEKRKRAYFVGKDGRTRALEKALFPFVNVIRRSRTMPSDFGVASSLEWVKEKRAEVDAFLSGRAGSVEESEEEEPVQPGVVVHEKRREKSLKKIHKIAKKYKVDLSAEPAKKERKSKSAKKEKKRRSHSSHSDEGKKKREKKSVKKAPKEKKKNQKVVTEEKPVQRKKKVVEKPVVPMEIAVLSEPTLTNNAMEEDDSETTDGTSNKGEETVDEEWKATQERLDRLMAMKPSEPVTNDEKFRDIWLTGYSQTNCV
jgi:hypothetical protein